AGLGRNLWRHLLFRDTAEPGDRDSPGAGGWRRPFKRNVCPARADSVRGWRSNWNRRSRGSDEVHGSAVIWCDAAGPAYIRRGTATPVSCCRHRCVSSVPPGHKGGSDRRPADGIAYTRAIPLVHPIAISSAPSETDIATAMSSTFSQRGRSIAITAVRSKGYAHTEEIA